MPETSKPKIDNFLEHYGIKGQRWGVRRKSGSSGSSSSGKDNKKGESSGSSSSGKDNKKGESSGSSSSGKDNKKGESSGSSSSGKDNKKDESPNSKEKSNSSSKGNKEKVKDLSQSDLKDRVDRMELEKRYNQLQADSSGVSQSKGKKLVKKLSKISQNVLEQQAQKALNDVVGKLINDKLVQKGLVNTPKNKN